MCVPAKCSPPTGEISGRPLSLSRDESDEGETDGQTTPIPSEPTPAHTNIIINPMVMML